MPISLRGDLVRRLMDQRFSSIVDMVVTWEERVTSGVQKTGRARDRATIYRWLDKGLPSNRGDIFGFAGLLDIDPIAMLEITDEGILRDFARERRLFQLGSGNRTPLSAFWPIYTPGPGWPDAEIASSYFARPWFTREFAHDPFAIANVYAALRLTSRVTEAFAPRTYHFAYRRTGARDGMWRPYGTVIGYENEINLLSESGDFQKVGDENSPSTVIAETYFGSGPAEFRIASLHDFDLEIAAPSDQDGAVRFHA